MKKTSFSLFIFYIFLMSGCKTSYSELKKFDELFDECVNDTLKMNLFSSNNSNDSILMNKKIASNFYHLFTFPQEFLEYQNDSIKTSVTALKKISLDDYIGYSIAFTNSEMNIPNFVCLYIYNKKTKKINLPIITEYTYGSEGTEWVMQSWMFDINKDGHKDLITRIYQCNLVGSDAHIGHFVDTLTTSIWSDSTFKAIVPQNYPNLKKQMVMNCTCACF
jgi:hypothetical protein